MCAHTHILKTSVRIKDFHISWVVTKDFVTDIYCYVFNFVCMHFLIYLAVLGIDPMVYPELFLQTF